MSGRIERKDIISDESINGIESLVRRFTRLNDEIREIFNKTSDLASLHNLSTNIVNGSVADALILLDYYEKKCFEKMLNGELKLINNTHIESYNTYKKFIDNCEKHYK